jgi:TonB family protein
MSSQTKLVYNPPTEEQGAGDGPEVIPALGGRFEILRKLSEDGTRFVYLARDLGRPAASDIVRLVVLSPLLANDYRQAELFRLEAAAAARLSHKNIVKAATAEAANGVHFYTTQEDSDHKTLRECLKLNGWLGASEAATIGLQIADALEYAHSQGVLHLTLDPEKVFISPDGTALVSGFGIDRDKNLMWARQERSHRSAAPYVSPEQILSADVDQRSDLYQLGIILYEMVTDRVPFESENSSDVRLKRLTRSPKPPYQFRPELSRELSRIIMALLGKRPDERPFSASDLKAIVRQCIETGAVADEECEEITWLAAPGDFAPPAVLLADESSSGMAAISEEEEPTGGGAAAPPLDAPAPILETETPILIGQEFQDIAYLRRVEDENNFEEIPEPTGDIVSGGNPLIDPGESPIQYPSSLPPREYMADGHLFSPVIFDKATPRWMMLLGAVIFLAGVGGLWATGVIPFQGAPAGVLILGEVAEPRQDDRVGVARTATLIPETEQVAPGPVKEIPSRPIILSSAVDSDSAVSKIRIAAAQKDTLVEAPSTAPLPPKSSEMVPPDLSHIEAVPVPQSAPPAELHDDKLSDLQPRELLPSMEGPTIEERSAPIIIRKSGDVLQNTATMRPRPVYPTAARSDNIKGPVTVEVTINEEGSVIAAKPISGPEQLRNAAVTAARGWKWTPTRVGRKRAQVVGTITFQFKD